MTEPKIDKTALSYWFPKIEAAGLLVPQTRIVNMPVLAQENLWAWFDGKEGTADQIAASRAFFGEIRVAAEALGLPCFLRTDYTSDKHEWERTCFLKTVDQIPRHVFAIAEFSEIAGIMGIPWDVWVVREFLPTIPLGICPRYGNMLICREFRFFVDDGAVRCVHPYWPRESLEQGGADMAALDYDQLCRWPHELSELAGAAGKAVGGSWSIDILETARGWHITDMAEANKSFHWEGCPNARHKM